VEKARLNGEGGGVARACLREVESFSHISNNHSARLSPRPLFAKLKGPTPSRSRHHPRGAVPLPLTQRMKQRVDGASAVSHPSSKNAMEKPRERYYVVVGNVLNLRFAFAGILKNYKKRVLETFFFNSIKHYNLSHLRIHTFSNFVISIIDFAHASSKVLGFHKTKSCGILRRFSLQG